MVAYLEKEGVEVGIIYSSPYTRCVQTASFVADAFNVPIRVEKGITEWPEKHDIRPPDSASITLQFPEVILPPPPQAKISRDFVVGFIRAKLNNQYINRSTRATHRC